MSAYPQKSAPWDGQISWDSLTHPWEELIGIDRHWSELIDIGINAMIDRHWSALGIDRGSPVITYEWHQKQPPVSIPINNFVARPPFKNLRGDQPNTMKKQKASKVASALFMVFRETIFFVPFLVFSIFPHLFGFFSDVTSISMSFFFYIIYASVFLYLKVWLNVEEEIVPVGV